MPEHVDIADPEIHEPKGVAAASAYEVYIADGVGSGAWGKLLSYGEINTLESDSVSVSSIGTTVQTLPFSNNGEENGMTADSANNRITVTDTGKYFVRFGISFSTTASADAGLYTFTIMDDAVESGVAMMRDMSGSSDTGSVSCAGILNITGGSHITVQVESDNGSDTDDIDIDFCNLLIMRVG